MVDAGRGPLRRQLARLAVALLLSSCTGTAGPSGPAPESVASEGWVELVVADTDIPADPARLAQGLGSEPPPCRLELELDGQPILSKALRPEGAAPPYSLHSRLRFRASPGRHLAAVHYSGCRVHGSQLDSLEAEIPISVGPGRMTRIHFDGSRLEAHPPREPRVGAAEPL